MYDKDFDNLVLEELESVNHDLKNLAAAMSEKMSEGLYVSPDDLGDYNSLRTMKSYFEGLKFHAGDDKAIDGLVEGLRSSATKIYKEDHLYKYIRGAAAFVLETIADFLPRQEA